MVLLTDKDLHPPSCEDTSSSLTSKISGKSDILIEKFPISLTMFTGERDSILTKGFTLLEDGRIDKEGTPLFSGGTAETVTITQLSDLEQLTNKLRSNQALSTGVFDLPKCDITTRNKLTEDAVAAGARARSLDHMTQPSNGLALIDYDAGPKMPEHLRCKTIGDVMSKLSRAIGSGLEP